MRSIALLAVAMAALLVPDPAHPWLSAQEANGPPAVTTSLLPGDVIRVRIWREEDLSGEFQVDEDGWVVLPLLGRERVVGIDPDVLRETLTREYGEYLVNPAVNVTPLRRVVVLGEVRMPGQYTVDATNSIADIIARAQGVTPQGDPDDIVLIRDGRRIQAGLSGTQSLQEAGIRSGDQVLVGQRGWISRNLSSIVSMASILANIYVIIAR